MLRHNVLHIFNLKREREKKSEREREKEKQTSKETRRKSVEICSGNEVIDYRQTNSKRQNEKREIS